VTNVEPPHRLLLIELSIARICGRAGAFFRRVTDGNVCAADRHAAGTDGKICATDRYSCAARPSFSNRQGNSLTSDNRRWQGIGSELIVHSIANEENVFGHRQGRMSGKRRSARSLIPFALAVVLVAAGWWFISA
jgi:hypothetical protein